MASDFTHFDTKMPSDVLGSLNVFDGFGHLQGIHATWPFLFDSILLRFCWSLAMLRGEGVAVSSILRPFANDMSLSEVPNHKEISTQYHQQFLSIYGQLRHTKP